MTLNLIRPADLIRVVAAGVDTLELFSATPLHSHWVEKLEKLKKTASDRFATQDALPVLVEVAGLIFTVARSGGIRGPLRLESDAMHVSLSPNAIKQLPRVTFEIRSRALWQNLDGVTANALAVAEALSDGHVALQVSRVDVTVDFQGWVPDRSNDRNFVCLARKRAEYTQSRELTGWHFGGGGSTLGRLYDKTVEIEGDEKADWFPVVWSLSGKYRKGAAVWRMEFQIRRETIKDLEVFGIAESVLSSWQECRQHLGSIFKTLFLPKIAGRHAKRCWLSLRLPRTASTRQRPDPRWLRVGELAQFKGCAPSVDLMLVQRETEFRRCLDQLAGYVARGIAERRILNNQLEAIDHMDAQATYQLLWHDLEHHLATKHTSLVEKADAKIEPLREQLRATERRQAAERIKGRDRLAVIDQIWPGSVAPSEFGVVGGTP